MDIYIENAYDIIHETSVDFVLRPCVKEVHIVQYDKSLPIIKVNLYNNGERYTLPEGAEANVRFGKFDHTFVYDHVLGCNAERNAIYFEVNVQMTTFAGRMGPVIELTQGHKYACSSPIPFVILKNPIQDGDIESSSYAPIIAELQYEIDDLTTRVENMEAVVTHDVVTLYTNQYDITGNKGFTGAVSISENGSLSLNFTPTDSSHAVNKGYADTKVAANAAITGSTKCKITYDTKGLVTGGADLVASDLPNNYGDDKNPYASKTKNYVLAAPSTADGIPTFRLLVVSDFPDNYGDDKNPYASKTKNYVLAAPSSANGVPTFRKLVSGDIPSLAASKITSGTFAIARIPDLSSLYLNLTTDQSADGYKTFVKPITVNDGFYYKLNKNAINQYSSSLTYSVGDLVVYNNTIYRCNIDILTPESFNPSKWTAVNENMHFLLDSSANPTIEQVLATQDWVDKYTLTESEVLTILRSR